MHRQLCAMVLIAFSISTCFAQWPWDVGAGTVYRLNVVEDVWLETPTSNYNSYQWLIVAGGGHAVYRKKRSLIRFEDVPINCTEVNHAMMYIYYHTSGKSSWESVYEVPFITRFLQAHRVLKSWQETQATTTRRNSTTYWQQEYLGYTDATRCPTGKTIIYAARPSSFVEIEVTSAVKSWKAGKPNYGLLLWATNEDDKGRDTRFYSKSYSDSTKHPYVLINCD